MDEHAFQDIRVTTQVGPPHPARVIHVCKGAFQQFAATSQQPNASGAANPATIRIDRVTRRRLRDPRLAPAIRLADVRAKAVRVQLEYDGATMTSLVGHNVVSEVHGFA